jgi:CRISPR type I-E-associated protein CasB/Cse2
MSSTAHEGAPPREPAKAEGWWTVLASIAGQLKGERLSTGDEAALRRMDVTAPGREIMALSRILQEANAHERVGAPADRWRVVVHCLALVEGNHAPGVATGTALANMGLSEARLNTLLAADHDVYIDMLATLARRIRSAGVALDWAPLAQIALFAGRNEEEADRARLRIAREFAKSAYANRKD